MSFPMVLSSRFATDAWHKKMTAGQCEKTTWYRTFILDLNGCNFQNLTQDMMMFTQQETLFVALPDNFVTGRAKTRCRDLLNLGENEV